MKLNEIGNDEWLSNQDRLAKRLQTLSRENRLNLLFLRDFSYMNTNSVDDNVVLAPFFAVQKNADESLTLLRHNLLFNIKNLNQNKRERVKATIDRQKYIFGLAKVLVDELNSPDF